MSFGDTYMHLKSERELRPGCTVIRPNGKYMKAVLALLGLTSCKAAPTPSVAPQKKEPAQVDPALDLNETSIYRSCVGMLAYLAI